MKFSLKALLTIMLAGSSLNLYPAAQSWDDVLVQKENDRMILQHRGTIVNYFAALEANEYEAIIKFFSIDAVVQSPFLGTKNAPEFYQGLVAKTKSAKITPIWIVINPNKPDTGMARFDCDWTLNDGTNVLFKAVDTFTFSADGQIVSLEIIFDTHPVRQAQEKAAQTRQRVETV